jgi:threonine dehydratase
MISKAVFLLGDEERQVVEGAGAVSVASIMENRGLFMGKEAVAVIEWGNIEDKLFRSILASEITKGLI